MARKYRCGGCGTAPEASAVPAGEFTCGVCGTAQGAAEAHARHVTRPLRAMKSRRNLGRPADLDDPGKAEARRRLRAAKAGTTALACGIAAPAALATGAWAVVRLATLGLGDPDAASASPIERVAARMARRGRREGGMGIAIGALMLGLVVLQLFGVL